jgi:HEPN domain-containing protein
MSDQPKLPVETPREWLRYAKGDLAVAEREMKSDSPVYPTICFLCQSAAEKFLKGFLISKGWVLEKTHDIVELLEFCSDHDKELGNMITEGSILNEYIIAGRYPGDIAFEGIGRRQAEEALEAARHIEKRVRELTAIVLSPTKSK